MFAMNNSEKIIILPPLVLAFMGDAYWTLAMRRRLIIANPNQKVNILHANTTKHVSASAQSVFFEKISCVLTEAETAIAARARNAHNNTTPKNSTLADYKRATAFEAVIGYNYLIGDNKRLEYFEELLTKGENKC